MAVRAGGAIDPSSRIDRLVRHQETRFRAVFLQAISIIRNQSTLDELAELLAAGRLEEALAAVDRAAQLIGNSYGEALAQSARNTAAWLSSNALTAVVSFDQTNVRAVNAINANRLRLIREFSGEQRAAVRQALSRGIAQGLNPRDQARAFRDSIGLTRRQEAAVANYRRLLGLAGTGDAEARESLTRALRDGRFDRSVRRAIRDSETLSPSQISRMVGRYRERYIAHRATTIARTEALRSAHQGSQEMYEQAFESGDLNRDEVQRFWVTARDERVRTTHSFVDGESRGPDEPFEVGFGQLMYPGDPNGPPEETINCRCALATRLDALG